MGILCQKVLAYEKGRILPIFLNCAFLIKKNCYCCLAVTGSASG